MNAARLDRNEVKPEIDNIYAYRLDARLRAVERVRRRAAVQSPARLLRRW